MDQMKPLALKAASVGAVGYGIGRVLRPNTNIVMSGGQRVPFDMFAGGACAAGSVVSDLAHQYVLPQIYTSEKYQNAVSAAVGAGTSTAAAAGAMALAEARLPGEVGLMKIAGMAVAADAIGGYLYQNVIEPAMM